MADDGLLPILEADLLTSRGQLAALVDRCEALAALWGRALALQDGRDAPVTLDDLRAVASRRGEEERALLESLLARVLQEEVDPWLS